MATRTTTLDSLRAVTKVSADTLDVETLRRYGPFDDCTSNQVIVAGEVLSKRDPSSCHMLEKEAAQMAVDLKEVYPAVSRGALAVEILTLLLSHLTLPSLTGLHHVQLDTRDAYSTDAMITQGLRINDLSARILPPGTQARICLKIPTTWAGLRACKVLTGEHGIPTLATTVFSSWQGVVAAEAGCRYIAPYIHTLPDVVGLAAPDSSDAIDRMMRVCATCQAYYTRHQLSTSVLPAALMSAEECLRLKGVACMTLAPSRLAELSSMTSAQADAIESRIGHVMSMDGINPARAQAALESEEAYNEGLKEEDKEGVVVASIKSALAIFNDSQIQLEKMLEEQCQQALDSKRA